MTCYKVRGKGRRLTLRFIDFDNHWVDLCGQVPDRCRENVNVFFAKLFLVSGLHSRNAFRINRPGTHFHSISSSFTMASSSWLFSMRVDSSISVRSADGEKSACACGSVVTRSKQLQHVRTITFITITRDV
jgi:hypothetical protein